MTYPRPDLRFEQALWQAGVRRVAGIDEAGRGALAGPVAAAAVILPPDLPAGALEGVRDSKQMTPKQREYWAEQVRVHALAWAVGYALPQEIDEKGILAAVYRAVRRALTCLRPSPEYLLLDYLRLPGCELPQTALIKGDQRALSIAAASVLAKTHRDALMRWWDARYPGYDFARHKGYGTAAHRQAIAALGLSPLHRHTFRCVPPEG